MGKWRGTGTTTGMVTRTMTNRTMTHKMYFFIVYNYYRRITLEDTTSHNLHLSPHSLPPPLSIASHNCQLLLDFAQAVEHRAQRLAAQLKVDIANLRHLTC